MHSKNGIWYTLADSPWWVMNYYDGAIIRFYFSSETHFNRFKREVNACESRMTATMSKRIGCFCCASKALVMAVVILLMSNSVIFPSRFTTLYIPFSFSLQQPRISVLATQGSRISLNRSIS